MRFLVEDHEVNGQLVALGGCLRPLLGHGRPGPLQRQLLEQAVAAVMLGASLKDHSELMLQLQGGKSAPLSYSVLNVREDLSFYGSAALREGATLGSDEGFATLCGADGLLAVTIFPRDTAQRPWQGITPTGQPDFAACLEGHFQQSAQLMTRVLLFCDPALPVAGGIMLQALPGAGDGAAESLGHLSTLAATLTTAELAALPPTEILSRLYAHERVRIFPLQGASFRCGCSRDRCLGTLRMLPRQDLAALRARGKAEINCEHCGRRYVIGAAELDKLLSEKSQ